MSDNKKYGRGMYGKGYYIALILCAAAISVAGFLYYRNADQVQPVLQEPQQQTLPADAEGEDLPVVATQPQEPQGTENPTEPAKKKIFKTAAPLAGEQVMGYAMDCLSYNETTRDWRVHDGIDIAAEAGTVVKAAAAGTVYTVFKDDTMGTTVVIRHDGGYTTQYASLAEEVDVEVGDVVQMGDAVGTVANTALLETAQGDHLHFSVTLNDEPIDPVKFLEME